MGRGGEDGLDPDIDRVDWTWRWDDEWIFTHTSGGYVYGYGYMSDEEDYGTDVKFLSTSSMSDAEEDVDVSSDTSISSYMEIDVDGDGLCADLTAIAAFGCPIILTCSLYDYDDYAEKPYEVEIRLGYDSVLGSLGTLEDWVEVTSEREIEDALETSRNVRLMGDIECSDNVEISHRTHLDLNGHTLSGEADVSKRARIENGKITSNGDGIIAEGDEKIEILSVDIEAGETGVSANADVEISNCSISGTSGVRMTGGSVTVAGDETIVQGSQYGAYVGGGSFSLTSGEIKAESSSTTVYGIYLTGSSSSAEIRGGSISSKNTDSSGDYASYGVYVASSSNITVSGGEITGEGNEGNGYGIYITGSSSKATLSGGTITGKNNSSTKVSVGVRIPSGTVTIEGSAEIAATSPLSNAYGLYITGGTANIYDGTITGEMTDEASYYAAGVRITSGTLNVYGGDIIGTGGESDGNGIRIAGGTATVENCSISATGSSSIGVRNMGGLLKLSSCSISSSTSSSSYGVYSSDSSASTTVSGGSISGGNGVYATSGTVTLESSCSVSATGSSGAAVYEAGGTINLDSCSLTGYYGIRCSSGSITATSSCTFGTCTYGAYSDGGTVNLNGAKMTSSVSSGAWADGGTVNVYGSTSISATSYGLYTTSGEIYVYGSSSVTSTGSYGAYVYGGYLKLYGSATITGSSSYGVYVYSSSSSEFEMTAGTIKGTRALQMTNGTATITGGTLTSTNSYTIYQSGGTLSCTATFSTAQNHQIYENGGTATFTNCSVNGGSSYDALYIDSGLVTISGSSSNFYSSSHYAIYVNSGTLYVENGNVYNSETSSASSYVIYNNSGTVYINGGYVYNGGSRTADSSETTARYTIYNNTGTLYLNGGEVRNNNIVSSASTYAVYNVKGNVYGNGTELYHYNYGYAFYNAAGTFNLAYGKYHSYYGPAIYVANTSNTSYIGTNVGINRSATPTEKQSACYIYKTGKDSACNDPVVQIAGGEVYIYGCYIESKYGPALKLTGSPYVWLGFVSTSAMYQDDSYTPCINATVSGEYAIYVNMGSAGNLYCQEADIYGVDYGIYIYDGAVGLTFVWITLSENSNDAYAIYVENRSTSYFSLSIYYEEVCAEKMSSSKTVYGIYSAKNSNKSSISYTTIVYNTTGKSSTKTS